MRKLLALSVVLMVPPYESVSAQTNERVYESYDFRFVTPGARAVAMGKAFTGLADDATAAFTNPAGLSNLLLAELSIEGVGTDIRNHRIVTLDDSFQDFTTRPFGEFVSTLSFASAVFPVGDFTISGFFRKLQKYEERFTNGDIEPYRNRPDALRGELNLNANEWGVGLSYLVTPQFSVGGSAVLTHTEVDVFSGSGNLRDNGADTVGTSVRPSGIVGIQWKLSKRLWVGASYYTGSAHVFEQTLRGPFTRRALVDGDPSNDREAFVPPRGFTCPGAVENRDSDRPDTVDLTGCTASLDYMIPGRITSGVAWKPSPSWTAVADVGWMNYSSVITENFRLVPFNDPREGFTPDLYSVNDVIEFHAGLEHVVFGETVAWAIRAGFFTDPDHSIRFSGLDADSAKNSPTRMEQARRFNALERSTHPGGTMGFGFAFGDGIQFDVAASFTRESYDFVFSTVLRP